MLPIEILIVIVLAIGATFFVVVVAIGLVINKWVELRQERKKESLYNFYSTLMADLLLQTVESSKQGTKSAMFQEYERLLEPVKSGLSWSTPVRRKTHRETIRLVLIDFARDLSGESLDRLLYFFYSLGFVDEEIKLLGSKEWWVRAQAARDLGLLRARRGIAALTAALEDDYEDVRNQAVQSLVVLVGVEALETIFKRTKNMSTWTTLELSVIVREFEDRSVPYLVEALTLSDQSVVLFAIEMLADIGFVSAVEPLLEMADSYPNVVVRSKAIEALGRLGDKRSEPLLNALLTNPYPRIRSSAVKALERIGSPSSVGILKERVKSGNLLDRISAARALAKSGAIGLEMLRSMSTEEESDLRGIALQVLEEQSTAPSPS